MFKLLKVGNNELGNHKREKNVDEKKKGQSDAKFRST